MTGSEYAEKVLSDAEKVAKEFADNPEIETIVGMSGMARKCLEKATVITELISVIEKMYDDLT